MILDNFWRKIQHTKDPFKVQGHRGEKLINLTPLPTQSVTQAIKLYSPSRKLQPIVSLPSGVFMETSIYKAAFSFFGKEVPPFLNWENGIGKKNVIWSSSQCTNWQPMAWLCFEIFAGGPQNPPHMSVLIVPWNLSPGASYLTLDGSSATP